MIMNMKLPIIAFGLALAGASVAAPGWLTSYDEAVKQSKKTGKPILADFTGSDWCTFCIRLHKEVFEKPEFKAWAAKNVILLSLDFPQDQKRITPALKKQNDALAKKYKVSAFPTVLFLDANGKKLGEYGYDKGGPSVWIPKAEKQIKG